MSFPDYINALVEDADIRTYLDLITSEHRDKPKFGAMTAVDVAVEVRVKNVLLSMIALFDVDVAVVDQLDILGAWVGASRNVSIPIDDVYFTWDGSEFLGWEYGSWQPSDAPVNVTSLPDDAYRNLIKGKIAANSWRGLTEDAYEIWGRVFPDIEVLIQDNENMSFSLILFGGIIDALTLALITGGYIQLKPEGVRQEHVFVPIDSGPLFGWDLDNDFFAGWDEGSWTREINAS